MLQPPRALSEVAACAGWWQLLSASARGALERKKLSSTIKFVYCFDGTLEEANILATELNGTEDDIQHFVCLWEAASSAAHYEQGRVASTPVLDVSVSAAIEARTRGGEVRAAASEVLRTEFTHQCMTSDAPLRAVKRSRRVENDPRGRGQSCDQ